jgi:hypothetical protein|tara:strand:+ start:968 stop:1261 length:294 start_codon:yes stop_codon:yes gene_type:complete
MNCKKCGNLLDDSSTCGECEDSYDSVSRPFHYNHTDGVECIDYIKQVLGLDGFISYCHGNMIKYQHRYRYKTNPVEDVEKAQWYLNRMLEALKEKHK